MKLDQLPPEVVELAKLHGIDLDQLPEELAGELTDENLEAVIGGKVYPGPGWWGPGWGWGGYGGWGYGGWGGYGGYGGYGRGGYGRGGYGGGGHGGGGGHR